MSFGALEPKVGLMLTGIGVVLLVPEFADAQNVGPGGMTAVAALLGIAGTSLGMIHAWDSAPSWSPYWDDASLWPDAAWVLVGILFGGAIFSHVFYTDNLWWKAGLSALVLTQLAAVTAPVFVSRRRTKPKDRIPSSHDGKGGKAA